MTDKAKQELLRKSEILKNTAQTLFEGQDFMRPVFGLVHAALEILKDRGKSYEEAVSAALIFLLHFEDCPGCLIGEEAEDDR